MSVRALCIAILVSACGAGDDDSLYGCGARPAADDDAAPAVDAAVSIDAPVSAPDAAPATDAATTSDAAPSPDGTASPDAGCDVVTCTSEVACHDGFDDDDDALVDCQDDDCDGDPDCERTGEITCNDGIDNDSDGDADCAEPACALACAVTACAAGQDALGFAATDLPQGIDNMATTTSAIPIAADGTVERVVVLVSIMHTFDDDLDIRLHSPAGTTRDLSTDNGGNRNDYIDTIFIDSAGQSITSGNAPFTGQFRPEESLDAYAGEALPGTWELRVFDDEFGDTGTLNRFELAVCVSPP